MQGPLHQNHRLLPRPPVPRQHSVPIWEHRRHPRSPCLQVNLAATGAALVKQPPSSRRTSSRSSQRSRTRQVWVRCGIARCSHCWFGAATRSAYGLGIVQGRRSAPAGLGRPTSGSPAVSWSSMIRLGRTIGGAEEALFRRSLACAVISLRGGCARCCLVCSGSDHPRRFCSTLDFP